MSGLSEQGWQNQIQALEATLAEMQERGRKAEQQRDAYLDGREMQRARAERAEAEVARLKALLPTPTPPVDPRRVVGAVVRGVCGGDYIVMREGSGITQSLLKTDCQVPVWATLDGDAFLRWATPEECARHGIPYVARDGSDQPATHQEVDGILGGSGPDLRALRDAYLDAIALEAGSESGSHEAVAAARKALVAAIQAKQGEVGRA